ncbi:MAG: DNA cytosine methyltransferase, partial [Armatimonadota bacterium]|nr:DNA cytosine methyltransferase [Armatimonadota bacterium]
MILDISDLNTFETSDLGITKKPLRLGKPKIKADNSIRLDLPIEGEEHYSGADMDSSYRFLDAWTGFSYCDIEKTESTDWPNNKVISLFSGAGGMDIGLEMAGFSTATCVEIDSHCRETLRHNRPDWKLVLGNDPTT